MVWTEEKDVKLLRAVAAEGVFINSRAGYREKKNFWAAAHFTNKTENYNLDH